MIRIVSKKDGFWRCGVRHSDKPTVYADDAFTREQLAQLKAEPMLIVDVLPDDKPKGDKPKGDKSKDDKPKSDEKPKNDDPKDDKPKGE